MPSAWVLRGGGTLGAAQVGMARALMEAGHYPDMVFGASSGALNAAALAAEPTLAGAAALGDLWARARRSDVFPLSPPTILKALVGRKDHLVSNARLGRWLSSVTGVRRVEDGVIPLSVVTTDLATGEEVLVQRGPLVPALLASSAIPGVYPPVHLNGRWLIDGSVAMDSAVEPAVVAGADDVWVLPGVPALEAGVGRSRSALDVLLRSSAILIARQHKEIARRWADKCHLHVVPYPVVAGVSAFGFGHSRQLTEAAYQSTRQWLHAGSDNREGSRGGSS